MSISLTAVYANFAQVKVHVNGKGIPFDMKIGDAGEAFFVFETDEDVPEDLITSPILEATIPGETNVGVSAGRFGAKEKTGGDSGNADGSEPSAPEKPLGVRILFKASQIFYI